MVYVICLSGIRFYIILTSHRKTVLKVSAEKRNKCFEGQKEYLFKLTDDTAKQMKKLLEKLRK
jgi:hypothetical protein